METPIEFRLKVVGTGCPEKDRRSTLISRERFEEMDPDPREYGDGNTPFVRTLSAIETREGAPTDVLYLVFNLNDPGVRLHLARNGYAFEAGTQLALPASVDPDPGPATA